MNIGEKFNLSINERNELWKQVIEQLEDYYSNTKAVDVSPELDKKKIAAFVSLFNLERGIETSDAINHVISGLKKYIVHTPHPGYFGLFNPRSNFAGILSDLIVAAFNPQMAAWSHSPFASEVENYLIVELGKKFGYNGKIDGTFCTGGAEANLTAVLAALNDKFPTYANDGLNGIDEKPVLYCSKETHHSVIRAARISGLGLNAIQTIETDHLNRMKTDQLEAIITKDLSDGFSPFMIIANAGSTGTGAIDPLREIAVMSRKFNLWFHADGAYGGALIVNENHKELLVGIEQSDSITFDVHKWFSAPMSTSMFITRHSEILSQTFSIYADYMPKEASAMKIIDPYTHSIQWSRRFSGLRFYLALLFYGWNGFEELISNSIEIGNYLKAKLQEFNWQVLNATHLPIACWVDPDYRSKNDFIPYICDGVLKSGKAWISIYNINDKPTLRACITNYATTKNEIDELIALINDLRTTYSKF